MIARTALTLFTVWAAITLVAYLASTVIPAAWIHYQLLP